LYAIEDLDLVPVITTACHGERHPRAAQCERRK
jgi:hypothetical protein